MRNSIIVIKVNKFQNYKLIVSSIYPPEILASNVDEDIPEGASAKMRFDQLKSENYAKRRGWDWAINAWTSVKDFFVPPKKKAPTTTTTTTSMPIDSFEIIDVLEAEILLQNLASEVQFSNEYIEPEEYEEGGILDLTSLSHDPGFHGLEYFNDF